MLTSSSRLPCGQPYLLLLNLHVGCACSNGYRLYDYERFVFSGPLSRIAGLYLHSIPSLATTPTEEQLYNVGQSSSVLTLVDRLAG